MGQVGRAGQVSADFAIASVTPTRAGRRGGLEILRNSLQTRHRRFQQLHDLEIIPPVPGCACFLHGLFHARNGVAGLGQRARPDVRRFGSTEPRVRLAQRRADAGHRALRVGANRDLAVGRVFGRTERAFACVERVVERQPVVALRDGVVGLLERFLGGVEIVDGVPVGAGGLRRIDRRLRLLEFLVRRTSARRGQRRKQGKRREKTARGHPFKYTCGCSTMKELSLDDRPREKLLRHSAASLGDNELLALVIGQGSRRAGALSVANSLLAAHGGLHGLVRCAPDDLSRVAGIGKARAVQILAALELGRRTLTRGSGVRVQLRNAREAAAYLLPRYGWRPVEQFGVVLLDSRHRVTRTTVLVSGTLNTSIVEPREVFREAALGGAAAIVAFHNHPSGDPSPSPEDVELTRRLAAAGVLMGIDLLDHIVLGDARYCSLKELGQL